MADHIDQTPPTEATKDEIQESNGQDLSWLQYIKQFVDERIKEFGISFTKSTTIFKVNVRLRESNPAAYTPELISIGPYHNKDPKYDSMEKYKYLYLQRFLNRKKEIIDAESCIRKLENLKSKALRCYNNIENLDRDKFSLMMLLDGCFLVEFFRERFGILPKGEEHYQPIIDNASMIYQVCQDVVLLENQLPFFVLTLLHDMTKCPDEESFLFMVISTLFPLSPKRRYIPKSEIDRLNAEQFDHLPHVVHMISCPSEMINSSEGTDAGKKKGFCNINIFFGKILQRMKRSKEIPPRPSEVIKSSEGTDASKKKGFCNINIFFGKILQRMKRSKEIPPRPSEVIKSSEGTDASKRKGFCNINIFFGKILQKMKRSKEIPDNPNICNIPSATELYEANFTKIGSAKEYDTATLLDIKYESGLLEIPSFVVEDSTETILRNLIAYEQHSSNKICYFSDYADIMDTY